MLLAIDVGNTNVTLGLFNGAQLAGSWRLQTLSTRTRDEYATLVRHLLLDSGFPPSSVDAIIMASVVPALTTVLSSTCATLFGIDAIQVDASLTTGVAIHYEPPSDVGADRIVNAVAAHHRYPGPCVVVDFGTATTFDCIDEAGAYLGGIIAPGLDLAVAALVHRAAKLPKVDIARPPRAIGQTTVQSIQSGAFFGYAALVDGLVDRIRSEMDAPAARVLATGGLAATIATASRTIQEVVDDLTLDGLRLLFEMNNDRRSGS
ncbi:MAG: type III pantothenate kinase [Myxococcota bacterium]